MHLLVSKLVENTAYKESTIKKILTNNGISNHFSLTTEDIIKLYKNTEYKNHKSFTLKIYLETIILDEHKIKYI